MWRSALLASVLWCSGAARAADGLVVWRLKPPSTTTWESVRTVGLLPNGFYLDAYCRVHRLDQDEVKAHVATASQVRLQDGLGWKTAQIPEGQSGLWVPPPEVPNPISLVSAEDVAYRAAQAGVEIASKLKAKDVIAAAGVDGLVSLEVERVSRGSDNVRLKLTGVVCAGDKERAVWSSTKQEERGVFSAVLVNGKPPEPAYLTAENKAVNVAVGALVGELTATWESVPLPLPTDKCTKKAAALLAKGDLPGARTKLEEAVTKKPDACAGPAVTYFSSLDALLSGDVGAAVDRANEAFRQAGQGEPYGQARVQLAILQNELASLQALSAPPAPAAGKVVASASASSPSSLLEQARDRAAGRGSPEPRSAAASASQVPAPQPSWPSIDGPARSQRVSAADAAVVIGIEDYLAAPDVPFARRDADAFYNLMVYTRGVPADRVERLTQNASRERIEQAIATGLSDVGVDGTLWVYFAGHGAADPSTGERLLLGDDVRRDPSSFASRGVSVDAIAARGRDAGRRVVMVLDACYNGTGRSGEAVAEAGTRFMVPAFRPLQGGAVAVWSAAGPDEMSGPLEPVRHGAFTYFAVGAFRGWADGELDGTRDGVVTGAEAQAYVSRALRSVQVRSQQPTAENLNDLSFEGVTETGPVLQ